MARRPTLTASGLLAESFGTRPYTVTLREEKVPGANVSLDYTLASGKRPKPTLGYPVRQKVRRGWEWDDDALERARIAAQDKSAELRLARMREEVLRPEVLTFADAVALYSDPVSGGMPRAAKSRKDYARVLKRWSAALGAGTPWNAIQKNVITARLRRREAEGMSPTGVQEVRVLRILTNWLLDQAEIDGLKDPVRGIKLKKVEARHTPSRPRYTSDELEGITRVRYEVDPRFPLFWALAIDSGARSKAVRILMRSMVDKTLEIDVDEAEAPYGWLEFPALKGQRSVLHLLTSFQRREVELAFDGYLQEMEVRWQDDGVDYPLFPGTRIIDAREKVVHVGSARSASPCSDTRPRQWLRDAERLARVEHMWRRSYHGVRRSVSDRLYEEIGLDALTSALGWSSRQTPEQVYLEKRKLGDRVKAREAMERGRKKP